MREVPAHRLEQGKRIFRAPTGRGDHVTLAVPEGKLTRHVWSFLSRVNRKLKAALAAHYRAGKLGPPGQVVSAESPDCGIPVVMA